MSQPTDREVQDDDACVEALLLLRYVPRERADDKPSIPEGWAEGMRFVINAKEEVHERGRSGLRPLNTLSVNMPSGSPRADEYEEEAVSEYEDDGSRSSDYKRARLPTPSPPRHLSISCLYQC